MEKVYTFKGFKKKNMKGLFLVLFVTLSGLAFGQECKLTVHIEFKGIEEGYDHLTKDELYIDGNLVKTTDERKESQSVDVKINVPRGTHTFKIVNWILYEGTWEQNTTENEYSIDAFGEIECNFRKKGKISVLYDLDDISSPHIKFK